MIIAAVTRDLMAQPQLQAVSQRLKAQFVVVGQAAELDRKIENAARGIAVIDLASAGAELDAVLDWATAPGRQWAVLAFGPHVHTAALERAAAAGCAAVYSRGQFLGQMQAIVGQWAEHLAGGADEADQSAE